MKATRPWTFAVFALMLLPLFSGWVSGHHSQAGYDTQKQVELRGVVVEFKWRNPHVFIVWDGKDSSGKPVQWTGEMSSTTTMMSAGMNRDSLKVGDEIIVTGNPSKSGNPNCLIRKIATADGKFSLDRLTGQ